MEKANETNAFAISHHLKDLESNANLSANPLKTKLFFGKRVTNKAKIQECINVQVANLPIKYLGVPLSNNKLKIMVW